MGKAGEGSKIGTARLDTNIRQDQMMDLYKLKVFKNKNHEEAVREALDLYFQQKYGKKAVVHIANSEDRVFLA